jgi:uncharacterized protein (DUF849 family)
MIASEKISDGIVINFCPTGMVPQKTDTPHVPVSVQEIVEQVHQAWELGITIAHLHARQPDGEPDWKPETYQRIFEGVRAHCPGLIICGSTSGRNVQDFERRSAVIELRPDMCSLTLSSLNFMHQASINAPDMIVSLAQKMNEYGVVPELECFHLGMINYGKYLAQKGILQGPSYWNLLFGNIAGFQADEDVMELSVRKVPEGGIVALGGLGAQQETATRYAVQHGLGVRIGLEDNIWYDAKRTTLATNQMLLQRVHQTMQQEGRTLMTAEELAVLGYRNRLKPAKILPNPQVSAIKAGISALASAVVPVLSEMIAIA